MAEDNLRYFMWFCRLALLEIILFSFICNIMTVFGAELVLSPWLKVEQNFICNPKLVWAVLCGNGDFTGLSQ